MATRWRIPPDSSRGQRVGELGEPDDAEQLGDALPALGPRPAGRPRGRRRCCRRRSSTGTASSPGRPCRGRRRGRRPVRPRPAPSPAVGSSSPPTIDSSVDLPQPEAPSRQTSSPRRRAGRPRRARTTSAAPARNTLTRRRPPARLDVSGGVARSGRARHGRAHGDVHVAQPAQEQVAAQADHPEHDQQGEHRVDGAEPLGADDLVRQALLRGEQLGDDEHQPCRGQVDAGRRR